MSIEFVSVSIRNFLSYGNNTTVIQLQRPGTTLIMGENLDRTEHGREGNGCGKSTLLNAIVYALYDRPISKDIPIDGLINNINKRNMEVSILFIIGDKEYVVKRERKAKKGNNVYLIINGEDKTPDSVAETNSEIERIIGMPFEMFVRIVVFSAQQPSFLDLPSRHATQANQTDFIEELFGLTMLSLKANMLKITISDTEREIINEKTRIGMLEQELQRHKTQVETAKQRVINWEVTNNGVIDGLQAKLDKLGEIDITSQHGLLKQLRSAEKRLVELNTIVDKCNRQYKQIETQLVKLRNELAQLELNKCPYCQQEYHNTQSKIKAVQTQIDDCNVEMFSVDELMEKTVSEIEDVTATITDTKLQITIDNIEELVEINAQRNNIEKRLQEAKDAINPHLDALSDLQSVSLGNVDYNQINTLTDLQEHQKFLLKLLTKKDSFVRKELLDKNIPYLNTRLSHHLSLLGLPHKVEFTQEMTASITQFGQPLGFGNLSAGQRARVNIALSLAFRDVLQQLHQKINICLFDEVLDVGLDGVGIIAAATALKLIAKEDDISMYIISHKNEVENMFDSVITVQMSKGFSYIKE